MFALIEMIFHVSTHRQMPSACEVPDSMAT